MEAASGSWFHPVCPRSVSAPRQRSESILCPCISWMFAGDRTTEVIVQICTCVISYQSVREREREAAWNEERAKRVEILVKWVKQDNVWEDKVNCALSVRLLSFLFQTTLIDLFFHCSSENQSLNPISVTASVYLIDLQITSQAHYPGKQQAGCLSEPSEMTAFTFPDLPFL